MTAQDARDIRRGVHKATLRIPFALLTASATSQSFDFAKALPVGSVILGAGVEVITAFDDASTGVWTADLGISGGDVDAILDGVDLEVEASHAVPQGAQATGLVGAVTLALLIDAGAVDVDTANAGELLATVLYSTGG